ncbi:MAG TPA: ImmA/IrrE family metallo-endopeptidase [Gemmatimonadales bacterium]|nr:ImmA/IrrE family metallo-endopeptidase [Gemmatimonadales bacterium]
MVRTGGKLIITGLLALATTGGAAARVSRAEPVVSVVSADTLRDVAVAVYDSVHPTIYVNERRMQEFDPGIRAFFLAHEYAHIRLHHTRSYALQASLTERHRTIMARELEADCAAAATLGRTDRDAVVAAARFFAEMGPFRYDREHPSGSQRGAKILSCLQAPETVATH